MDDPSDNSLIAVFIFYNVSTGIQAPLAFSEEFKHCNIATFDGRDWIIIDFDRTGLVARAIHCNRDANHLLNSLPKLKEVSAIITVDIKDRAKYRWLPWWARSCNEICRYRAGIDIGFTFNPVHLYYKLLRLRKKRNYEILAHWRREYGIHSERA